MSSPTKVAPEPPYPDVESRDADDAAPIEDADYERRLLRGEPRREVHAVEPHAAAARHQRALRLAVRAEEPAQLRIHLPVAIVLRDGSSLRGWPCDDVPAEALEPPPAGGHLGHAPNETSASSTVH